MICIDDEIPFDIPQGWKWERVGNLFFVTKLAGFEYTKYFTKGAISSNNSIPIVRAQNVRMGYFEENKSEAITDMLSNQLERSSLYKKCLLMTFIGAGIGDTCIFPAEKRNHLAPNVAKIEPYNDCLSLDYVLIALMSPCGQRGVYSIKKSTAQPSLSMETIRRLLIPIPPIRQQQCISEKYFALLPLIDRYSKVDDEKKQLNDEIRTILTKSILQEAIKGKIVPQDPNDEPSLILLERIKKEKLNLVKNGKLKKKDIVDSVIFKGDDNKYYEKVGHKTVEITDEIPFDIPESWSWCRLKQCSEILYGYPFDSQRFNDAGLGSPVIRIRNVVPGNTNTYTDEPCSQRYLINPGDMLVGMDGNFNVQFWRGTPALLNQRVCRINANAEVVLQRFLYYYLPIAFEEIEKGVSFVTVKHLSDKHLTNQLVPIPPKQEQKRIIDKIDSLLNLIK